MSAVHRKGTYRRSLGKGALGEMRVSRERRDAASQRHLQERWDPVSCGAGLGCAVGIYAGGEGGIYSNMCYVAEVPTRCPQA